MGPLRAFWPLFPICLAAGWLLRAALPSAPPLSSSHAGLLFLLLAGVLAGFMSWSARRLRNFIKGAEGEETVARILSFLPQGHTVFNDLQLSDGGPAFDHIVVAPTGVYVIETKNWSGEITFEKGRVLCNGKLPSRPPIKQVKEAAAALIDYLTEVHCPEVPVHPVLCFVNNSLKDGPANIGGVRICSDAGLTGLFENTLETPVPGGTLSLVTSELIHSIEEK
jgi:hypothetical protein